MTDLERRIAEGLADLRARWADRIAATPSRADAAPQGDGPRNRHGMPKEPPGQNVFEVDEWPVLDIGVTTNVTPERWKLTVDGAVASPYTLDWAGFHALPQVDEQQDFHCVNGWSILDVTFRGVRLETLAALARPLPEATHLMAYGADGYSTNLPLEEALKPAVLVATQLNGQPIPSDRGGPVRMVVPELWAWKGSKWINRLEFMTQDRRGYWEIRGYSNTAHPWRDDRMW